jgi:selenoprotein W-related protein
LAADLLDKYEEDIESVTLIPSEGGVYEITVNGEPIYSKKSNGRHAEDGEVTRLVGEFLKKGK